MNWEAIGAVGEIVGAGGVIGSLLYLAIQTKKASLVTRSQAGDSWVAEYNKLLFQSWEDDFGDLLVRGLEDFDGLTQSEQMKFHTWMAAHILSTQNTYLQVEFGTTDEQRVEGILTFNAMLLKTKGGRIWWELFKGIQPPEFQIVMDKKIEEVEPISAIWPWFKPED